MRWLLSVCSFLLLAGCDCGGTTLTPCGSDDECEVGEMCRDGECVPRPDGGGADGGRDAGVPDFDAGGCGPMTVVCGRE